MFMKRYDFDMYKNDKTTSLANDMTRVCIWNEMTMKCLRNDMTMIRYENNMIMLWYDVFVELICL